MFIITLLLAIMGLICTDLFVPSLPAIAHHFHQTPNYAQLTISLFLAGFALSQLFYGPVSDYTGRKSPLIIGVLLFMFGSMICLTATSFHCLCIGRIIQGIGVGAGLSLSRVILRDRYKDMNLAIKTAQMGVFVALTPAVAPFFGGILQQQFGFHASFIFMLAYGVIVLILLLTRFQETALQKNKNLTVLSTLTNYKKLLTNSFFMRYVTIAGFVFAAIILYANIMPFIVQDQLKLSPIENGATLLIAALGVSVGAFISNRIVRRMTPAWLVKIGLISFAVNGLLLILSDHFFGTTLFCLLPLVFLVTMACGFILPNAIALCFSKIHCNIGIAGAIYGATQIFISMLINFLLNMIPHQGQELLGMFYLLIGLLGLRLVPYSKMRKLLNEVQKTPVI